MISYVDFLLKSNYNPESVSAYNIREPVFFKANKSKSD